jgi:hypothetical protein
MVNTRYKASESKILPIPTPPWLGLWIFDPTVQVPLGKNPQSLLKMCMELMQPFQVGEETSWSLPEPEANCLELSQPAHSHIV